MRTFSTTLTMAESIDHQIAALAKRQRGYVTRPQVAKLGLSLDAIKRRIRSGRLIPVYSGVYAVGHLPTLPQDCAYGALLACGPTAVLSHGTAACVWGIWRRWEMPFEVTTANKRARNGIRVHRARLDRRDITTQIGLRVTTAARTVFDIAPRLTETGLRRAIADLRRPGHLHIHQLADLLERLPRSPGARRVRPLIDVPRGNPTRSDLEDRYLAFAGRWGLPRPETNVWVAGREVDIWYPEERVIVELDGWDFHSDRESFEDDRDEDATALALGIATIRVTDPRMRNSPEREAARIMTILRTRRAA